MKKINKAVVFAVIAAAAAVCCVILLISGGGNKKTAYIYSEGTLIRTVRLDENTEFTVKTDKGYNIIRVENGRIGVIDADCPDKTCVHTGFTDNSFLPVICIPHRLEITVRED